MFLYHLTTGDCLLNKKKTTPFFGKALALSVRYVLSSLYEGGETI